jgi:HAD superfamily hydrolase (TIGR01484 family)
LTTDPIQLVVTDLDGTLWETPAEVPHRTVEAVAEVGRRGIPLLVATGRRVGSTRDPLADLGLRPAAVVLNGALGLHLDSGERFHRGGFSSSDAVGVLGAFAAVNLEPCVYVDHDVEPVRVGSRPSTHPVHLDSFGDEAVLADLEAVVAAEHVLSFSVLGLAEDVARTVGGLLGELANPHVDLDRFYGGYTVTVAPTEQSKWDGIVAFCAAQGLDSKRVLAVGDGANDIEMLDGAAIAVVPEDAHIGARERADHVVARASEGGWADILDLL